MSLFHHSLERTHGRSLLACVIIIAGMPALAACSDDVTDEKADSRVEPTDGDNHVDWGVVDTASGVDTAGPADVSSTTATDTGTTAEDAASGGDVDAVAPGSDAAIAGDTAAKPDGCGDKEKCNGADDDCDGLTDEDICEDGNVCTADKCSPEFETCSHDALKDDSGCDNGQKCNGPDYCQGAVCLPGPATDCNDGNPCTQDSCDKDKNKCHNKALSDGIICSDANACTLGDQCGKGLCLPGSVTQCDDQNECTNDACDTKQGCSNTIAANKACEDGNACTIGDLCDAGACKGGKKKACPIGKPCETVTCQTADGKCGLLAIKDGDACEDIDKCNIAKTCKSGACVGGKIKDCNDNNVCTKDTCDSMSGGNCVNIKAPDGTECDDGNACTKDDVCKANKCTAVPRDCVDKNPCTTDACDTKTGCVFKNNADFCEDGSKCTLKDTCKAGQCEAGAKKNCDDKEECTVDSCSAKSGLCLHDGSQLEGKACAGDNDPCTAGDKCSVGKCVIGNSKICTDTDPCTLDLCDSKTAKCIFKPQKTGAACSDGSLCTFKDVCDSKGKCIGQKLPCNDSNGCTVDGCKAASGQCTFTPLKPSEPCDDGDVCTTGDKCNSKLQCIPGAAKKCDDGKPCTADVCDKKTGKCSHNKIVGCCESDKACDDGKVCTVITCNLSTRICNAPIKKAGCCDGDVDCNDNNACTVDTCVNNQCNFAGTEPCVCPVGSVLLGEFAIWCGKVNVYMPASTGVWQVDPNCSSGCNNKNLAYCKKLFAKSKSIKAVAVTKVKKPFKTAGCKTTAMNNGKNQFACCGAAQ